MALKFREISPVRTCTKTYADYRSYKPYLKADFNNRCGYTDCVDMWFGGVGTFHIDHFVPWKNYPSKPELKTSYTNLIYCCSYVNILKTNDEGDYLDPCDTDFNEHFTRSTDGAIIAKDDSEVAKHMYSKLKLYLTRYRIIWMLDHLFEKMKQLKAIIRLTPDGDKKNQQLIVMGELSMLMTDYLEYLSGNQ